MYINDTKFACATCIKGHRSSHCTHADRPLFEIKKKGRPVTQCSHCRDLRRNRQIHVKCVCMDRSQSEPSPIATSSTNSGEIEHTSHCTCKRSKKKSIHRPTTATSPLAIDITSPATVYMQGTPSPPTSASPSMHEPASWSWAFIAPKQEFDISTAEEKQASLRPLDNSNDYSFVFHKSIEPKKQQHRRSSLARRPSPIHGICPHNLTRASSSDSSAKSEPVIIPNDDRHHLSLYSGSAEMQSQRISTSVPQSSTPMFSSENENSAVDSLDFSLDGLSDDLAMLIDDKQSRACDSMQGDNENVTNIPISSTSSISGEFTGELANTLTFESAAELMAIFENDISQQQKRQQQQLQFTERQASNQNCCGSFAPSSSCCADLSLPGESVCITITPVTGQPQSQQVTSRIVTCRCGPDCTCSGCLVHAGSNWMIDPYAGIPSSSCSSDDEDHAMMESGATHSALPWLDGTSHDSM